jgi:hypothetical protein
MVKREVPEEKRKTIVPITILALRRFSGPPDFGLLGEKGFVRSVG